MRRLDDLFAGNRAWAAEMRRRDAEFFARLALQQAPRYLWIGCSDSRVPANQIVGLLPGEMFVHRNVANVVAHADLNCLAAIQFAVDVLRVGHIVVCGHYGCSGVQAVLRRAKLGLVDNWLRHVEDVRIRHRGQLAGLADDAARADRLCELNVVEQAVNVALTTVVRDAWARGQELVVHAWIYALEDGLLRDLGLDVASEAEVEAVAERARAGPPGGERPLPEAGPRRERRAEGVR